MQRNFGCWKADGQVVTDSTDLKMCPKAAMAKSKPDLQRVTPRWLRSWQDQGFLEEVDLWAKSKRIN